MAKADVGLVGLGTMGSSLALNIAEKGFRVCVWNRTVERIGGFLEEAGPLAARIEPAMSLEHLVSALRPPRAIILMVAAGDAVDQQIAALSPLLSEGDVIIDAGNANFRDTVRREKALAGRGVDLVGAGVSGGEEGARHGPSIMVGGSERAYRRIEPVLTAIAARYGDEPCVAHLGPDGAGHFVKTIHNGIEYADMQMIAEIYGVLRDGVGLDAAAMSRLFSDWNAGPLDSYLIEVTAEVLAAADTDTGAPLVDIILDRAGQKGTGRWAAIEAQMMGTPATTIEAAVAARSLSSAKPERERAAALYGDLGLQLDRKDRRPLVDDLEAALLAGKVAAYAQGFSVMAQASREFGWALDLGTVARIWRAGCIIRSRFLGDIARLEGEAAADLLLAPAFSAIMTRTHHALRRVVSSAQLAGIPVPALSAALAYFDATRQALSTANLIQGQRDYFGAHGFERTDRDGNHHGPWASDR